MFIVARLRKDWHGLLGRYARRSIRGLDLRRPRRLTGRRLLVIGPDDVHAHLAAEEERLVGRVERESVGAHGAARQIEGDGLMRAQGLPPHFEARISELAGDAGTRREADVVLHDEPLGFAVEQPAHRLHARPALLVGGELRLDGMQLDQLRVLHVLIGVVGAHHIGAVLLVDALERRVRHAQVAVIDLHPADARGDAADGDAEARRNEIGGEHQHRHHREHLAQDGDVAAVPRGARESLLMLLGGAHAIPVAARNQLRFERHGNAPPSRYGPPQV